MTACGSHSVSGSDSSSGCGKPPVLESGSTIHLQVDGSDRYYLLYVPRNYDKTRPYRLVIAYHARGYTAEQVANDCGTAGSDGTACDYYHLTDQANDSAIFATPMGEGSGSDTGWPNTNNADVHLTDAILSQLESNFCIDTTRIFATGWSYGGSMSYEMACQRPNVIRAIAVYSGATLSGSCTPTAPVAYYASHGIGDAVLPIADGEALRDQFVAANGCTAQTTQDPASGSGMHICTSYEGCSAGHPVTWCSFDGPHTPDPNPTTTGPYTSWEWAEAWNFLSQF
jgi:poly(3-hydroxybutyrate) depolymerase